MAIDWKGAAEKASKLDYDPAEAVAMQKLIMKKIQQRLNVISETFKKHGHLGKGKDKIAKLLKESDFEASKIFKNKNTETKALRRGLAEMLTTNPNFFAKKGLWDIFQQDLSLLEGDQLFRTLKGWDDKLSGFKTATGKVGHHTTLSSLNDALQGTTEEWRVGFNKLAESEGFKIGTEGISEYAPGVHKAFSTKKGFPNIRMVKGKLAEKLAPLMPDATFTGGRLEVVKGVNPKLDEFLDNLQSISTHGKWAGGEVGFKIPKAVKKLSTDEAFKVARNTLGAEEVIADHGRKIDKLLDNYLDKSNFTSLDEALDGLTSKVKQPNWQPPNVRDTLIKETDIELGKSLDVLDQSRLGKFNPKILKSAKLAAKMSKIATGAGAAEAGVMLASGQVVPGGIALAMQTPAVQKQVAKLLLKQGVKLIPGLSFGGGLLQGAGYAASGRPLKATASVLGGIVGEIPGIGDVAQSMIDLGLTVDDVRVAKQKAKTKKPELEVNEKGFMHTPIDESTDPAFAKTVKDLGEDVSQFDTSGFKGSTRMDDILKTSRKLSRGVMKGF